MEAIVRVIRFAEEDGDAFIDRAPTLAHHAHADDQVCGIRCLQAKATFRQDGFAPKSGRPPWAFGRTRLRHFNRCSNSAIGRSQHGSIACSQASASDDQQKTDQHLRRSHFCRMAGAEVEGVHHAFGPECTRSYQNSTLRGKPAENLSRPQTPRTRLAAVAADVTRLKLKGPDELSQLAPGHFITGRRTMLR